MESTLAQVGMAGAPDRDHGLIAGDDRLHERAAVGMSVVAERQHRRHNYAARMHRALPEAVVELDAVGGGAAEESGVDEVGAPRAAGTISGLISAAAMVASAASRESATNPCASASRSPAGLPR